MRNKDKDIYQKKKVSYEDKESCQFICSDFYQNIEYQKEYPAFILVHKEYPIQPAPLHWHPGPEIVYSRNQQLKVIINGECVDVAEQECALISGGALHSVEPKLNKRGQDVLSISFDGVYLERMFPELQTKKISYLTGTDKSREELNALCEKIHGLVEMKKRDYFKLNEILFAMLGLIYREFAKEEEVNGTDQRKIHKKMRDILTYVTDHFQEALTTEKVAQEFGYSREHFSRLFKKYAGQSFKQYLNEYRLIQAEQDLHNTEKKMIEIAFDNGFPDEKSFYSSFKKKYGSTPAKYRREK